MPWVDFYPSFSDIGRFNNWRPEQFSGSQAARLLYHAFSGSKSPLWVSKGATENDFQN
jgi:hypothetical protein